MRKLINITEEAIETYRKYYIRNCNKWVSKNMAKLSADALDKPLIIEGKELILKGQITDRDFILIDSTDNTIYMVGESIVVDALKS